MISAQIFVMVVIAIASAIGGAYAYAEAVRRANSKQHALLAANAQAATSALAVDLVNFKLHVEREFAGNGYIRDVETRLVNRLDRIENKIDGAIRANAHG